MKNFTTQIVKGVAIATALLGFAFTASAQVWTPPTAVPPANNVPAPINVSATAQIKNGGLTVGYTSGGFTNFGTSLLAGHTDIGPYDSCYYWPGPGPCPVLGSASQYFANATKSTSLVENLLKALKPAVAFALGVGTPSGDALHVNGNASITGSVLVSGHAVCLSTGTGCPTTSTSYASIFPITTNPTPTQLTNQGAYLGWNGLTGGTGETDIINNHGEGPGGFAFQDVPPGGTPRTTLMTITGGGDVGIGVGPSDRLSINGPYANSLLSLQAGSSTMWHFGVTNGYGDGLQIGDGGTMTPRLTIKKSTGYVGIGTTAPSTQLDINGQIRIEGGSPGVTKVLMSDANGVGTWVANNMPIYAMNMHCLPNTEERQNGVLTYLPWCNEPGSGGRTWWNVKDAPYSTSGPGPYSYTLGTDGSNVGSQPPVGYGDVFFRGWQGPGGGRSLISGNCYGITSINWYQHCNAYYPPMGVMLPALPNSPYWPTSMTAPFSTGVGGGSGPYYVMP